MTGWLLAGLLRRAVPALRVLDLGVATGGLWPWWPEAMLALPDRRALPPGRDRVLHALGDSTADDHALAENALLAGFGLGRADPDLALGTPEAWGGAGPRLVVAPEDPGPWLAMGAWVLTTAPDPSPLPRILLVLGSGGAVAQAQLLLPEAALAPTLARLAAAAAELAGPGWEHAARLVTPRLGTLTLFAPPGAWTGLCLPAATLPRWAEAPGRLRLLLGVLPPQPLHIHVLGEGIGALLLDGAPHDARMGFTPMAGQPVVLGLAGADAVLHAVEIAPA